MSNTTDTKKYRLLKDISMPYRSIKAGTVGDCLEPYEYISFGEGTNYLAYSIKDIKNKPDWFEEVLPVSEPVKEKIEIELYQDIWSEMTHKVSDKGLFHEYRLLFYTVDNPKEKIPAIKQAIESVLNGDTVVEDKGISLIEYYARIGDYVTALTLLKEKYSGKNFELMMEMLSKVEIQEPK